MCNAEKVKPEDFYANSEDISSLVEWIFRGNDTLTIKPDDKVRFEFNGWDETGDYLCFNFTVISADGKENTGNMAVDYEEKEVVYVQLK